MAIGQRLRHKIPTIRCCKVRGVHSCRSSFVKLTAMREPYVSLFKESPDIFVRAQKTTDAASASDKAVSRERLFGRLQEPKFVERLSYFNELFRVVAGPQLMSQLETGQASEVARALVMAQREVAKMNVPDEFLHIHSRIIDNLGVKSVLSSDVRKALEVLEIAVSPDLTKQQDYGNTAWIRMCRLANPEEEEETHLGTWKWIKSCAAKHAEEIRADLGKVENKVHCGRTGCSGCKKCTTGRSAEFRKCLLSFWRERLKVLRESVLSTNLQPERVRAERVVHVLLCCGCVSSCGVERDFASMRARVSDLRTSLGIKTLSNELWVAKNDKRPAEAKQWLWNAMKWWEQARQRRIVQPKKRKKTAEDEDEDGKVREGDASGDVNNGWAWIQWKDKAADEEVARIQRSLQTRFQAIFGDAITSAAVSLVHLAACIACYGSKAKLVRKPRLKVSQKPAAKKAASKTKLLARVRSASGSSSASSSSTSSASVSSSSVSAEP